VWVTPPSRESTPHTPADLSPSTIFWLAIIKWPQTQLKQNQGAEPFLRLVFGGITINLEA